MAGEWLPVELNTPRKNEVITIATRLKMDRRLVLGTLFDIWIWASENAVNCRVKADIAIMSNVLSLPEGFAEAMVVVGWLKETSLGLKFPGAEWWLDNGMKARLKKNRRQEKWRAKKTSTRASTDVDGDELKNDAPQSTSASTREEKRREENILGDESPKTPLAATDDLPPVVMQFPCVGKYARWDLFQPKADEYAAAYPGVDVIAECRKARQWCVDNPSRRKTAKGMPRFLNAWLERAQNERTGKSAPIPTFEPVPEPDTAEMAKKMQEDGAW